MTCNWPGLSKVDWACLGGEKFSGFQVDVIHGAGDIGIDIGPVELFLVYLQLGCGLVDLRSLH
jgi:hypothetical protein